MLKAGKPLVYIAYFPYVLAKGNNAFITGKIGVEASIQHLPTVYHRRFIVVTRRNNLLFKGRLCSIRKQLIVVSLVVLLFLAFIPGKQRIHRRRGCHTPIADSATDITIDLL